MWTNKIKLKKISFSNLKVLLVLIILLGFLLRLYNLANVPSGFYSDEAAFGYNAYSILHTGRDEYGKFIPLVLRSFDDYKGAFYAYTVIPSISIFGLNPFAVRLPSIIFDTLTILLIYFVVKELLTSRKIGLIAAFLYAFSPWSINISRTTGDVIVALTFTMFAVLSLTKLVRKFDIRWIIIALLSGCISIISYAPFRFYIVILAFLFLLLSIKQVGKKVSFSKSSLLVLIAFLILGLTYTLMSSTARFNQVSIFSTPQTQLVLNEQIREDQNSLVLITRLFHNKVTNYTRTFLENYQQYFTLDFLALNGGKPQRENVPDTGLFYLWEIPFLLIGLYVIAKKRKRQEIFFVLWWLLLLLPAAVTYDEIPNVHRTLIILPAICVIISIGIEQVLRYKLFTSFKFYKIIFVAISLVAIYEFLYFYHQFNTHFNVHQAWYRGYAYKELAKDLDTLKPKYNRIIITKANASPYIYILFYDKYDPLKYQKLGSPRDFDNTGFDKYYFVAEDCPSIESVKRNYKRLGKKILYVDKGNCDSDKYTKDIGDVDWQDGNPAFKLVEYNIKINK